MSSINNYVKNVLVGGGLVSKPVEKYNVNTDFLTLFLIALAQLLIKSLLVMLTYNIMIPKLMYNYNPEYKRARFIRITFVDSILLVILFSNLFNRI